MNAVNWRAWIWEYALPAAAVIVLGPIWVLIWGDLNILAFAVALVLAFLTGLVLRPARVWVTPAVVVLIFALVVYALEALGVSEPETNVGLIPGLALILGLPMTFLIWLGRELRPNARQHSRRRTRPRATAT